MNDKELEPSGASNMPVQAFIAANKLHGWEFPVSGDASAWGR